MMLKKMYDTRVNDLEAFKSSYISDQKYDMSLEFENFKRTAAKVFKKLDRQIEILEAIESSVEEKLVAFERLLHMADSVNVSGASGSNRRHEVLALVDRGLSIDEISQVLGMLRGEVELILNLNK